MHGQVVIAKHLDDVLDASCSVRVHRYFNNMAEARVNDSLKGGERSHTYELLDAVVAELVHHDVRHYL